VSACFGLFVCVGAGVGVVGRFRSGVGCVGFLAGKWSGGMGWQPPGSAEPHLNGLSGFLPIQRHPHITTPPGLAPNNVLGSMRVDRGNQWPGHAPPRPWVRPYLVENTVSRPICEVKQPQAPLVLRSGMTREPVVSYSQLFFLRFGMRRFAPSADLPNHVLDAA
jgi:hypothetical protein